MSTRIAYLENIFLAETGIGTLPTTVFKKRASRYNPNNKTITMTAAKKHKYQSDYIEFFWFHEAYHFYQDEKGTLSDIEEDIPTDAVEYLYLKDELEANLFAYNICKLYDFPIPDWISERYFKDNYIPLKELVA